MWFAFGSYKLLNSSGGIVASIKMVSLYSANSFIGISPTYWLLFFNNPQNCFGLCFSISGNVNYNLARLCLHVFTNALNMFVACAWFLPFRFTALLYLSRACLQLSSNHGAKCFSHLLGFLALFFVVIRSTPTFAASSSIKDSILYDRSSLSVSCALFIMWNAFENSGVAVCSAHFFALVLYSCRHSPSIHLYVFSSSLFCVYSTDFSVLGWPTLYSAWGPAVLSSWSLSLLWGFPALCDVCSFWVIGMIVDSMSWSVMLSASIFVCYTCSIDLLHSI